MYTGTVEVIADDQNVYDIIRGVKSIHNRYANDYDKICKYFIGDTVIDTCKNLFTFLRRSSFYFIEGEDLQTLRSPAAILATGKVHGIDCKNYSLFSAGILDAINRTGLQSIPFCYRFASDKLFDPTPCHVFVVVYPNTDNEIWIDPIPQVNYFNEHLIYYYHTDKKYKAMSLQILSGRSFGDVSGEDVVNLGGEVITGNWVAAANTVIAKIFSSGGPNPNDWKGWHSDGSDARYWVLQDGDSVPNEAVNIISYIRANGMATMLVSSSGVPAVTIAQIANKLSRGGFPNEAKQFLNDGNALNKNTNNKPDTKTGSQNQLITFGLIGAGLFMVMNQKKRVSGSSNTFLLVGAGVAAYFFLKPKPISEVKNRIAIAYGITSEADLKFLDSVPEQTLRDIDSGKIGIETIAT